jgi:hypothetical protein
VASSVLLNNRLGSGLGERGRSLLSRCFDSFTFLGRCFGIGAGLALDLLSCFFLLALFATAIFFT